MTWITMTPTAPTTTPRSLHQRGLWTLLAIAPGAVLQVWRLEPERAAMVLVAVAVALVVEALALRARGRPVFSGLGDAGAMLTGLLVGLLLPVGVTPWMVGIAAAVAVGIGRQAYGGTGQYLFHPAMLGVVLVTLLTQVPMTVDVFRSAPELLAAGAYLAGGLLLVALRIVRWQAPLALVVALLVLALPGWLLTDAVAEVVVLPLLSASTLLIVFFVAGDPVAGCTTARGRIVFGAGVAALAAALWRDGRFATALPAAVLLMNLAAPALDRWLAPAPAVAKP
jgi:electron transport complex protein RnfD